MLKILLWLIPSQPLFWKAALILSCCTLSCVPKRRIIAPGVLWPPFDRFRFIAGLRALGGSLILQPSPISTWNSLGYLLAMSAIPNVPEEIAHIQPNNNGAAATHLFKARENARHIEDVSKSAPKEHTLSSHETNGHTNGQAAEAPWLLHDAPIENQRPVRVIVIGAGYSGVYAGIRIPERIRNCECGFVVTSNDRGFC